MEDGPTAGYILFGILVLLDVFLYGFSMATEALRARDIEKRLEQDSSKSRKTLRLMKVLDFSNTYSAALQLCIAALNIGIGVSLMLLLKAQVSPVIIAVLVYLFMVIAVLLPGKLAGRKPEKWAYRFITPIYYVVCLLRPVTFVVSASAGLLMRLFGIKDDGRENDVTEEEIIHMVNEGHEQGLIQASEAEMISNIFEYGDKEAQDIMSHRNDICGIDGSVTIEAAIEYMLESKYSRFPVYDENLDKIIGILHLKDAMRIHMEENILDKPLKEAGELLREAVFVPKTKNIDELFKEMQSAKLQMVIVVDEYGQTEGLIAMEDILEEIVGNIMDEYDTEEEYIAETGNDEYIIDGKTPLEELEEKLQVTFEDDSYDTVNGFLISRMDRIPRENEVFDTDYQGYNFKILSVQNKMIQSVLVTRVATGETTLDENIK